jgi:hypothetical protein
MGKKTKNRQNWHPNTKHDCSVDKLGEIWRFPMCIERYCRMLRYWFKLLCTDNCILKCLYESSVVKPNDKLTFYKYMAYKYN